MKRSQRVQCLILVCLLVGVGVQAARAQSVAVWLTTHDQSKRLQQQSSVAFSNGTGGTNCVYVDETQRYQEVEGFGAAFTDTTGYILNQVARPTARTNAMRNLFTRNGSGIGLSFMRIPMGASDLARYHYSYDDLPAGQTDTNLALFSIAHDLVDIIPLIQQARQLNPQLKLMVNPWSPPGWMKTSGSMIGGSLLPSMYGPFANYFVKFIEAYQAQGIPIDYVSLQNEPAYVPGDYPGMDMDAASQTVVLRDYLLPAFAASALTNKVLVFDHNWDYPAYPDTVLSDATLRGSTQVAGIAWHGYGGTPGMMLSLANKYSSKGNYQTEHSGGDWVGDQVRTDFEEIIHVMRSSGKSFVKWNLAGDQNDGPHAGGCANCTPLVIVNSSSGAVSYSVDFYTLGHFSKFVLPGAYRIYSGNSAGIVSAGFLNPDGSKVLVAFNDTSANSTFQVQWGSQSFAYTLPSYSGATFNWTGTQSGGYTVSATNRVQASSFNSASGLVTEPTADALGGYDLGYADNNDYAVYQNVNFAAGFTNVTARIASSGGGTLEFRLGSATGSRIATLTITNSGGWQNWLTVTGGVANTSGLSDLYLVYKGGTGIGNLNWFQFGGALAGGSPGPATQLIWSTQPGLATNGSPFAQQPVLQTADQYGNPSTNGLPAMLAVAISQSAGAGPLLGTTNLNIGMAGEKGVFQFTDLQINSSGTTNRLTAAGTSTTNTTSTNLLINGDFNAPYSGAPPDNWTTWTYGGGWANHENNGGVTLDGSYYMVIGGFANQGGGAYQVIPGTAGRTYTLSVQSGADSWWLPYGEMRLFFLDASANQLAAQVQSTVDPAVYGTNYDIPHPWGDYSLTAIAPPGTTQMKVEFAEPNGAGSVWFENALLTESSSLPWLASGTTLPFTVHPQIPPTSQTNYIADIKDNGSGTYTLQFVGTIGVRYYVETTTNLVPPIVWEAMAGSTNTVANTNGLWSHTVTNTSGQGFFRAAVVGP
jgi:glucosylceramidase